jgi:hypothetical protein
MTYWEYGGNFSSCVSAKLDEIPIPSGGNSPIVTFYFEAKYLPIINIFFFSIS